MKILKSNLKSNLKSKLFLACAFSFGTALCFAGGTSGGPAIGLAYRILDVISDQKGYGYDSKLDACLETALSKVIQKCAPGAATTLNIGKIHCRYSNAVAGPYWCTITSSSDPKKSFDIQGPKAQALFGAMEVAGIQGDGAAGTIHIMSTSLNFKFDFTEFNGGGGAHLDYTSDN